MSSTHIPFNGRQILQTVVTILLSFQRWSGKLFVRGVGSTILRAGAPCRDHTSEFSLVPEGVNWYLPRRNGSIEACGIPFLEMGCRKL